MWKFITCIHILYLGSLTCEASYQVEIVFIGLSTFHKISKSLDVLMFSNFWDIKRASGL